MKDEEHRAARIQSELLSANKVAENWNIKYESEKQNREKLANQLLESNKLTNQKSEEIENVIGEMERYRHLYNEISEKYNNERKVFENNIGPTTLEQNRKLQFYRGDTLECNTLVLVFEVLYSNLCVSGDEFCAL